MTAIEPGPAKLVRTLVAWKRARQPIYVEDVLNWLLDNNLVSAYTIQQAYSATDLGVPYESPPQLLDAALELNKPEANTQQWSF